MHALHILHLLHLAHLLCIAHGGIWHLIPNVRGGYAVCQIVPWHHAGEFAANNCHR
jgi:hypothetical protein